LHDFIVFIVDSRHWRSTLRLCLRLVTSVTMISARSPENAAIALGGLHRRIRSSPTDAAPDAPYGLAPAIMLTTADAAVLGATSMGRPSCWLPNGGGAVIDFTVSGRIDRLTFH
jgi:hypothetical protein